MAAIISRVVTSPAPPHTEYLVTLPGRRPKDWSAEAQHAFIFPTHGIADNVAVELRRDLKTTTGPDGMRLYFFIHARTVEDHERSTRFTRKQSHHNSRHDRRQQRQEEMAADDVQRLEESYRL